MTADLSKLKNIFTLYPADENGRTINIGDINNVFVLNSVYYPNVILYSYGTIFNPLEERVMSLKDVKEKDFDVDISELVEKSYEENPVFFFVYNTDNYYHFVYDSLPYLISYKYLKNKHSDLKLLMSNPNSNKSEPYRFVIEFLEFLGIKKEDIVWIEKNRVYKKVYISSSYTHGHDSSLPPREEIYNLYRSLPATGLPSPKKIYVSRRSWIHGDSSNIGTNYTTRRRMINEDELVKKLIDEGFEEIFTENLSTTEKINMFSNAEIVVGAIGGGISNVLFSKPETKLIAIISPGFLDVNARFVYSLNKVNVKYTKNSRHVSDEHFKKYMRIITTDGIVGEISDVSDDYVTIIYSEEKLAGWNLSGSFLTKQVKKTDAKALDNGLNSEWIADVDEIMRLVNE